MRVLTFGWDFPPMKNGGLGVACFGLTRELVGQGVEIVFVLPKKQATIGDPTFIFADEAHKITVRPVESSLLPYQSTDTYIESIEYDKVTGAPIHRRRTILEEIHRFAHQASLIAKEEQFDLIHAHDWTSYLAGVAAKRASGKPLMLHVHATSFDQAASVHVDPAMYQVECEGFAAADIIVAVSEFTKRILIERHGVDARKIAVVHNGCDTTTPATLTPMLADLKAQGKKIVLYHGRITIQKGVDYFVRAARRVVDVDPNVVFVISGWGDMTTQIIEQVGRERLSGHVIFAGALWDEERDRMYQAADLVVMPSVSEPFGLVPLEALQHGTPSVISKQSGVAEVLLHALKVDFWDVDEMANQILAALRYDVLRQQLTNHGRGELQKLSWREAAIKVAKLYQRLVHYV
ncbi:MAG: D-inositol 3-phosphate glycosyltransferase [Candidatus Parcubacteria bacterium]|jgi:glycosyltransferase involved in cell wall biosynthesis